MIKILEPFGLNHRQIRTAVFRLVQEDWLVARQMGRRSYYSFTEAGRKHYEKAARRIYYAGRQPWDGKWTLDLASREVLRRLSHDCWNLDEIEKRYNHFIRRFHPVYRAVGRARNMAAERSFQVRTLLIHEYRRIHLQDSDLPEQLLPPNWSGAAAYNLTKNIYGAVRDSSVEYLMKNMETVEGNLREPDPEFFSRFR